MLLWHGAEPIGIVVFAAPAAALSLRSRYFGLVNPRSGVQLANLNERLWLLQRVVLHPTYRGAGLAGPFIRRACQSCPVDWIETLTAMGHANPVFERAGFVQVGEFDNATVPWERHVAYGVRGRMSADSRAKGRYTRPVYYVFDNRRRGA